MLVTLCPRDLFDIVLFPPFADTMSNLLELIPIVFLLDPRLKSSNYWIYIPPFFFSDCSWMLFRCIAPCLELDAPVGSFVPFLYLTGLMSFSIESSEPNESSTISLWIFILDWGSFVMGVLCSLLYFFGILIGIGLSSLLSMLSLYWCFFGCFSLSAVSRSLGL